MARLQAAGVSVHPLAHRILSNFGGLVIPQGIKSWLDVLNDDPIEFGVTDDVIEVCDMVPVFEEELGMTLTPVGILPRFGTIIVVADQGDVFGYHGSTLIDFGRTFEEALETTLIFEKRPVGIRTFGEEGHLVPPWPEPAANL